MECFILNCTENVSIKQKLANKRGTLGVCKANPFIQPHLPLWGQPQVLCQQATALAWLKSHSGSVPLSQHVPPQSPGQELPLCRLSFTHANSGHKRKTTSVQGKDTSLICSNFWKIRIFTNDIRNTSVTSHSSSEISHQTPWLTLWMPWEKPDNYNELNLETTVIFSMD